MQQANAHKIDTAERPRDTARAPIYVSVRSGFACSPPIDMRAASATTAALHKTLHDLEITHD